MAACDRTTARCLLAMARAERERGPTSLRELAEALGVTLSGARYHLLKLRKLGLVDGSKYEARTNVLTAAGWAAVMDGGFVRCARCEAQHTRLGRCQCGVVPMRPVVWDGDHVPVLEVEDDG